MVKMLKTLAIVTVGWILIWTVVDHHAQGLARFPDFWPTILFTVVEVVTLSVAVGLISTSLSSLNPTAPTRSEQPSKPGMRAD